MHRFYVPPGDQPAEFPLPEAEAHHAAQVLRMREGERVLVLDGVGHETLCQVRSVGKREVVLKVMQRHAVAPKPYQITLLQAVTKGKTMDLIIQKATELGVHRLVPILSERSVAHVEGERAEQKVDKWLQTAIEAAKQCGSAWLPKIEAPVATNAYLARGERYDLPLVATLQADSRHAREHFDAFVREHRRVPKSVGIWVGPEGDYTPAELNAIRGAGAHPISLGPLILRSETAAVYCLSVLNYELQAPRDPG